MLNKAIYAVAVTGLFISTVGAVDTTNPTTRTSTTTTTTPTQKTRTTSTQTQQQTQPQKIEVQIDSANKNVRPVMTNVTEDARSDENDRIMRDVQQKLKSSYKNYSINIHVLDGVVTLTGTVPTAQDKRNIESDITALQGVKKVVNNLEAGNLVPKVNSKY